MKIRKEYIAAAVIIVASVLYLLFRSDSSVNYEVPQFDAVEKEAIVSIFFGGEEGSVSLRKEGENWIITPQGYRASMSEVNRLLSEAEGLSIVDLISPREDYGRYELEDDQALTIEISTTDGPVRQFKVGKSSSSAIYSYIRLNDRKGVYSVRGNLKTIFSLSMDKWRDRQVLSFVPEEAAALEVVKGDETYILTRTAVTEIPGWSRDGEALEDSAAMDSHMKTLGMLKTTGYMDEEPQGDAQVSIKITTPSGIHEMQVFDKLDKGYAATSSYVDGAFLIPFYIGDMILDL